MSTHKIIGLAMVGMFFTVLFILVYFAPDKEERKEIREKIHCLLIMLAMFAYICVAGILISGCTTTKIVKVPVPVPCVKPKLIPKPRDYMAELKPPVAPPEFVRACLATRVTCNNFYEAYQISRGE